MYWIANAIYPSLQVLKTWVIQYLFNYLRHLSSKRAAFAATSKWWKEEPAEPVESRNICVLNGGGAFLNYWLTWGPEALLIDGLRIVAACCFRQHFGQQVALPFTFFQTQNGSYFTAMNSIVMIPERLLGHPFSLPRTLCFVFSRNWMTTRGPHCWHHCKKQGGVWLMAGMLSTKSLSLAISMRYFFQISWFVWHVYDIF